MTIKVQAKKLAAGASVALATTGLSSCNDNGAVDPLPPPLDCNTVNTGQELSATATRSADTVNVAITNTAFANWRVDRVTAISGATLVTTTLPRPGSGEPLQLVLKLAMPTTTQAVFSIEATLTGFSGEICSVQRTFTVTISTGGVQISLARPDELPLAARQHASIVLTAQEGRTVELAAHTLYLGPRAVSWSVNAGELSAATGSPVQWTLPAAAGIYQAELVVDYGADGFAYDVLLLELA